jgi:hypothetical protein
MTAACILLLLIWFVISLFHQFDVKLIAALKRRDIASLIPHWKLFAPRPGTSDYHLVFRDYDAHAGWSRWRELPISDGPWSFWRGIWNPGKRRIKMLSDVVRDGSKLVTIIPLADLILTLPYLAVLNYVSRLPRANASLSTQFMVLKSDGFSDDREPQLVFLSAMHDLDSSVLVPLHAQ